MNGLDKIEQLFKRSIEWGLRTRVQGLDGLQRWNVFKNILSASKARVSWRPHVKELFVEMRSTLKIQECKDEFKGTPEEIQKNWEKHHFYLQHARIPVLNYNDACLVRLMQIAYNAGQLKALWSDDFYTNEMRVFYNTNNLDNIHTYMTDDDLMTLNNSITYDIIENIERLFIQNINGGGKSKYKQNYLNGKINYMGMKCNDYQGC